MLKEYRIKRGYSLEKLAELCDISWRNLQRIENGKMDVARFETIKKIIKVLEISDKDIIKLIKEDENNKVLEFMA
jgi:DNA-binding Xre family transcriptional regulator